MTIQFFRNHGNRRKSYDLIYLAIQYDEKLFDDFDLIDIKFFV